MSFGSYAESSTLKLALENAYATSILVAAAGNSKIPIGPCMGCYPFYPAAYSFVLGVEDRPRPEDGYTNYDQDGPISTEYTTFGEWFLNYELAAPGTGIMSTVPGGGYASLTGTSMATPLVAGGLVLYKEIKSENSNEMIFGDLIHSSDDPATASPGIVDFLNSLQIEPQPYLRYVSADVSDEFNSQNGNGFCGTYWGRVSSVRGRYC